MPRNSGFLLTDGTSMYIARHKDQKKEFGTKLLCEKITKDFRPVLDDNGKLLKVLKERSLLKGIGMVD